MVDMLQIATTQWILLATVPAFYRWIVLAFDLIKEYAPEC